MVDAAEALKLTARDLSALGIVDDVIQEPVGGAHHDYDVTARNLQQALEKHFSEIERTDREKLIELRYQKFRKMGVFEG